MTFTPVPQTASAELVGYRPETAPREAYVRGFVRIGERSVPRVATELSLRDRLGAWRVRWGIGRDRYRVPPGLYAVGAPDPSAPLLISANYKLSFDFLRRELSGLDAWILVIDTKGINVWCAAGKGSFGTEELVEKIARLRLGEILAHRSLILPQLSAPGVCAPELSRLTGFRAIYGPVRAADLKTFLSNGLRKDREMRTVRFGLADRVVLTPVELVHALPIAAAGIGLAALAALPAVGDYAQRFLRLAAVYVGSVFVGTVGFPLLLPWLPTRSFAVKGAVLGALWGILGALAAAARPLQALSLFLASGVVVSFLGLNFTGCTTFTNQAGASREVERGYIPLLAAAVLAVLAAACSALLGS